MIYIPITLTLSNVSNQDLLVEIPRGTIFEVNDRASRAQNVRIINDLKVKLKPKQTIKLKGSGECVNPARAVPHHIPGRLTIFLSA
jgi:hypothetical protein